MSDSSSDEYFTDESSSEEEVSEDSSDDNLDSAKICTVDEELQNLSDQQLVSKSILEDESEDEVVKAIAQEKIKPREHPPDIHCDDSVFDISFHPNKDILAVATVVGDVVLYKYNNESTEVIETLELHTKPCRDVEFSEDGSLLFSCSKDKSIMVTDTASGKLKTFYDSAHEEPVYCLSIIDENIFASGDDGGTVKLWDLRKPNPIFSLKNVDGYVSSIVTTEAKRLIVCASGDGYLTSINVGTQKLHIQSESYDAELTCMCLMRRETKLVVGSSTGSLYIFNWGEFGYHSDEFPGPKDGFNHMVPITENIVAMACDDGALRGVHLFPHRHLGVVGQHQFSVERLDISGDGTYIASCSHDQLIKFWNIRYFENVSVDVKKDINKDKRKKKIESNLPSSKLKDTSDFFSGLS